MNSRDSPAQLAQDQTVQNRGGTRTERGVRPEVLGPSGASGRQPASSSHAFLNIPYDEEFRDLYLAYIAGTVAFGLLPRATLEIPGGARRLERIFDLITSCGYSFHDLSRVELDRKYPQTPRFNMPFELGMVVAWEKMHSGQHA